MTQVEAMKLALEALEYLDVTAEHYVDDRIPYAAITALRQAIEQAQKQEPVAFRTESRITKAVGYWSDRVPDYIDANSWEITPLYTKEQL